MSNKPKCVNPHCKGYAQTTNSLGMCYKCGEMAHFLVWMLPQILEIKPKQAEQKQEDKKEVPIWTPDSGPSGIIR